MSSSEWTMTVPVMVKDEVRTSVCSVESGMTTPGPSNFKELSRPNHQAACCVPLMVAPPAPSRKTVLLGKTVAPGLHGPKEHPELIPCVNPSPTPPPALKFSPAKLKPKDRHEPRLKGGPPINTVPLVMATLSARASRGKTSAAKKKRTEANNGSAALRE